MTHAPDVHPLRSNKAVVINGIVLIIVGITIGFVTLIEAFSTSNFQLVIFILPALSLVKLGTLVFTVHVDDASDHHLLRHTAIPVINIHNFAHDNKAWNNVSRWENKNRAWEKKRTESIEKHQMERAESIGKPQKKLESWSLRLSR